MMLLWTKMTLGNLPKMVWIMEEGSNTVDMMV